MMTVWQYMFNDTSSRLHQRCTHNDGDNKCWQLEWWFAFYDGIFGI